MYIDLKDDYTIQLQENAHWIQSIIRHREHLVTGNSISSTAYIGILGSENHVLHSLAHETGHYLVVKYYSYEAFTTYEHEVLAWRLAIKILKKMNVKIDYKVIRYCLKSYRKKRIA